MTNQENIRQISAHFQFEGRFLKSQPYGDGHINNTYKLDFEVENGVKSYILQEVNSSIFEQPEIVTRNIDTVAKHFRKKDYPREHLVLIPTQNKVFSFQKNNSYWRAFHYIEDSSVYNTAENPEMAYQAAKGFAEFDRYLSDLPAQSIVAALPDFHNFERRVQDFKAALKKDIVDRKKKIKKELDELLTYMPNYEYFIKLKLPINVVHGDPKINNLLFFRNLYIVKSVIDYETLIPSSYLTDFGDMVRSMACSHSEEEQNIEKIVFSKAKYQAILSGFTEELSPLLCKKEKDNLVLAARVVILIQAIRFLTDFLKGDVYYKIDYPLHNLMRAKNQMALLSDFTNKIKF